VIELSDDDDQVDVLLWGGQTPCPPREPRELDSLMWQRTVSELKFNAECENDYPCIKPPEHTSRRASEVTTVMSKYPCLSCNRLQKLTVKPDQDPSSCPGLGSPHWHCEACTSTQKKALEDETDQLLYFHRKWQKVSDSGGDNSHQLEQVGVLNGMLRPATSAVCDLDKV